MALSGETRVGFFWMNSRREGLNFKSDTEETNWPDTAFHRVGIVASYSNNDTVKPMNTDSLRDGWRYFSNILTIHLILVLHDHERIIIDVAEELDVRSIRQVLAPAKSDKSHHAYSTLQKRSDAVCRQDRRKLTSSSIGNLSRARDDRRTTIDVSVGRRNRISSYSLQSWSGTCCDIYQSECRSMNVDYTFMKLMKRTVRYLCHISQFRICL